VALNIGGIANLTAIPAAASPNQIIAFDTGPGNMVIDAAVSILTRGKQTYDRDGRLAARGRAHGPTLRALLSAKYFALPPPKSCGREEFGEPFTRALLKRLARVSPALTIADTIATLTAFTGASVADAIARFAPPLAAATLSGFSRRKTQKLAGDLIASGGGTKNRALMRVIADHIAPLGYALSTSDDHGVPSQAKEAIAFAVLAYESYHARPANLPSATGASRAAILGKLSRA
jgi:anhydro-N-acetylmuramic acid kinase